MHNITRLNRYHRLLQEKERFAQLAEMAPISIVISDPDGQEHFANSTAQALFASVPDATSECLLLSRTTRPICRQAAWRDLTGVDHPIKCMTSTEWSNQSACLTLFMTPLPAKSSKPNTRRYNGNY